MIIRPSCSLSQLQSQRMCSSDITLTDLSRDFNFNIQGVTPDRMTPERLLQRLKNNQNLCTLFEITNGVGAVSRLEAAINGGNVQSIRDKAAEGASSERTELTVKYIR